MAIQSDDRPPRLTLAVDASWCTLDRPLQDPAKLDPALDWVIHLLESGELDQARWRTGVDFAAGAGLALPLLLELDWEGIAAEADFDAALAKLGLALPRAYRADKSLRHVTATLALAADDLQRVAGRAFGVRQRVADLLSLGPIVRLELPAAAQAFNADAQQAAGIDRVPRRAGDPYLDGSGVVVGIIDDGCAFAHRNFIRARQPGAPFSTRLLGLYDPSRTDTAGGWRRHPTLPGCELDQAALNAALAAARVGGDLLDEDAAYAAVAYPIPDLASHGTHVMDIAAGNGCALASEPGVAPAADLVFVQLPAGAIAHGGSALDKPIIEGLDYILDKAGNRPVVVNLSYGGYHGPHDGSSTVEAAIDARLGQAPNRAVVVAAGNGFQADCHAQGTLVAASAPTTTRRWILKPGDPTPNDVQVWYERGAKLAVTIVAPDGSEAGPVHLGMRRRKILYDGVVIGSVSNRRTRAGSALNRIVVVLNQTAALSGPNSSSPAPSGTWALRLELVAGTRSTFDAWIDRDSSGRPGGARRQQSHFHPDDATARGTLGSYATGRLALAVGAYNTATQEVCRYSACGPTRDDRVKPDVLAPAEEDAAGRGILSASSRAASPARMNGTSAAAPLVAGIVALLLQRAAAAGKALTAAEIGDLVRNGAAAASPGLPLLVPNRYVAVDARRKDKQGDPAIWPNLVGAGRAHLRETIDQV